MFAQIFRRKSVCRSSLRTEGSFWQFYSAIRFIALMLLTTSTLGCPVYVVPKKYASIEEAYPTKESYAITPDMPSESYKKAAFNAPYDDVFRAVTVAVSSESLVTKEYDNRLNIESSDKVAGVILATGMEYLTHYYYAIKVLKIRTNITEVQIVCKFQARCMVFPTKKHCEPEWYSNEIIHSPREPVMNSIFTETRSKLFTEGAM